MPLQHRHAHPQRDLMDTVGDIIDGVKREAEPQNGGGGGGGGGGGEDDDGPMPTQIDAPKKTDGLGTEIAKATGEPTLPGDDITKATNTADLTAPTESSSSDSNGGGGSNAGVIAGIVFGVLGGLLLLGLGIYFFVSKRNKGNQQNGEEKLTPMDKAMPPPPPMKDSSTPGKSPRLSLRPVTQFFPNFAAGDKRTSKGPGPSYAMGAAGAAGAGRRSPGPNPFERPDTSQSSHPANPFGNQAERPHTPIAEDHSMYSRTQPPTPDRNNKPLPATGRQQSMHGPATDRTTQWELTLPDTRGPPSPAGTEFSMSSVAPGTGPTAPSGGAAAIAAAGGPKNTSVHRVQLDFKPSLEDEMELKAGELVRLLHEYDDGWALCIRLDRSRQGVVPRTCLSTRPVKPRTPNGNGDSRSGPLPINPQGAPRPQGPGQRPMTPSGRPESPGPLRPGTATGPRSQSPAGFRSQSPAGLRSQSPMGRQQPRPMSPAGAPPMSPAPSARPQPRPMSPAGAPPMSPGPSARSQPQPMSPAGAPPMSPGPNARSQSPGPRQQPAARPRAPSKSHGPSPMNPASQRQTLWPAPPGQAM